MSALELKTELHHFINDINDNTILKVLHTLLKRQAKNGLVGYSSAGKPLTKKAFIQRIEKAKEQIRKGQFVTMEELEKEAESW